MDSKSSLNNQKHKEKKNSPVFITVRKNISINLILKHANVYKDKTSP